MTSDLEAAAVRIYEEWNEGFNTRDLDRVLALYADEAVIETLAVLSTYPDSKEGVLRGKRAIRELFEANVQALSGAFEGLYRTGLFFSNGRHLTWEYPRLKPGGTQIDLFESIDIADGLIVYHRVYWGWRGLQNLIAHREKRRA